VIIHRAIAAARALLGALFLSLCCAACVDSDNNRYHHAAAIASAHPLATQAGMEILAAGGNAFDAAVAVSAALAVVEPFSSGLGGGGFWLLHRARDGFQVMVDGREKAPLEARRDMYLDPDGDVISGATVEGALAAGIPGEPAALVHIAQIYGRLPLRQSLGPAIRLAREGFLVDERYRRMAQFRLTELQGNSEAARIFLDGGAVPEIGKSIVQLDLAKTLNAIAQRGNNGFYSGKVAEQLVAGVSAAGGVWSLDGLATYKVVEREPVVGSYHGLTITSASPPSSGGVALVEMLNMLSGYNLAAMNKADRTHVIIEVMRRAYRDRAEYLGDPDFVQVPVARLTSKQYATRLAETINLNAATSSASLPGRAAVQGGDDTTHFSILDGDGNRVSATLSINYPFGACVVPPGTGVLLNDEMDDFSVKPGVPNLYGLTGAEANAIAPGKRPLSSMSPTFVESKYGLAILGTPGGSRIITAVLLAVLDFADGHLPESWVSLPRFHHQYYPDVVQYEAGAFDAKTLQRLAAKGHTLEANASTWGNMQAVYLDKRINRVLAASDPRGVGAAEVEMQPGK
jgi:gamma-glutamyltranspeptidase / glutathione hydrolase